MIDGFTPGECGAEGAEAEDLMRRHFEALGAAMNKGGAR